MSPPAARAASRAATAPARLPRQSRPAASPPDQTRPARPARPARPVAPRTAPAESARTSFDSRPRARPRAQSQRRLSFGVLWIGIAGVLLAGVVGVNVLVLRQNVQLDQSTRERTRLRADNAGLASRVSAAVAASRIEGLAQRSLGLVPAAPEQTTYLDLGRAK